MLEAALVRSALDVFQKAQRMKCVCHKNPDGDAIGSLLGMAALLQEAYPDKVVSSYCIDPSPSTFEFLPGALGIRQDLMPATGDVFVFLDAAEAKLTSYDVTYPQLFDGTYPSIVLDHHPTNPKFGTVNIILPTAASTCEIVVLFADQAGWKISEDIATLLLTGVYTDTGGLLHSNTSPAVYRTVARLLRAGARQQAIVQHVFRTAKLSTLKLWGRVLENISLTPEGGAIAALTEGDFRATGADYSELTGAIDYVNAVPGMRFSLILSERGGVVKGSLRTLRDDIDVAEMASKFSGGGHKRAAGFSVPGKLQPEVRWKVVQEEKSSDRAGGSQASGQ